jgi:hypothetical protein
MRGYSRSIVNTSWNPSGLSGTTPVTFSSKSMNCSRAGLCVIQNHLQVTDILAILCEDVNTSQSRYLPMFWNVLGHAEVHLLAPAELSIIYRFERFLLQQRDNHYPAIAGPLSHCAYWIEFFDMPNPSNPPDLGEELVDPLL